jgi:hypothetical protein
MTSRPGSNLNRSLRIGSCSNILFGEIIFIVAWRTEITAGEDHVQDREVCGRSSVCSDRDAFLFNGGSSADMPNQGMRSARSVRMPWPNWFMWLPTRRLSSVVVPQLVCLSRQLLWRYSCKLTEVEGGSHASFHRSKKRGSQEAKIEEFRASGARGLSPSSRIRSWKTRFYDFLRTLSN